MEFQNQRKFLLTTKAFNVFSFVLMVALFSTPISNAITKISAKYNTTFTPAGYAFSIWGLIWFLQAIYVVYIAIPYRDDRKVSILKAIGFTLPVGWLLQITWQFAFYYEVMPLASICIFSALLFLAISYYRINQVAPNVIRFIFHGASNYDDYKNEDSAKEKAFTTFEYFIVYAPTALNTAWLTAASFVSVFITLTWDGVQYSPAVSASFAVLATIIALGLLVHFRDVVYPSVIIWALLAIAVKQKGVEYVVTSCYACIAILAVAIGLTELLIVYWSVSGKRGFLRQTEVKHEKLLGN